MPCRKGQITSRFKKSTPGVFKKCRGWLSGSTTNSSTGGSSSCSDHVELLEKFRRKETETWKGADNFSPKGLAVKPRFSGGLKKTPQNYTITVVMKTVKS